MDRHYERGLLKLLTDFSTRMLCHVSMANRNATHRRMRKWKCNEWKLHPLFSVEKCLKSPPPPQRPPGVVGRLGRRRKESSRGDASHRPPRAYYAIFGYWVPSESLCGGQRAQNLVTLIIFVLKRTWWWYLLHKIGFKTLFDSSFAEY